MATITGKETMLYDPARHEPLRLIPWDERQVQAAIDCIVFDATFRYSEANYWPLHPLDQEGNEAAGQVETPMYHGACGVFWALDYLNAVGAATLPKSYVADLDRLLARNRAWLGDSAEREHASFLLGDTSIRMMAFGEAQTDDIERVLADLIAGNLDPPRAN